MLGLEDQLSLVETLTRGGWSMTAAQMRTLQGSYVYVLWRGAEMLYIGVKSAAGERPFNPDHHVLGGPWPRCSNAWPEDAERTQPGDELAIYPMPTPAVARWAEQVMLNRWRGRWNRRGGSEVVLEALEAGEARRLGGFKNERAGLELVL